MKNLAFLVLVIFSISGCSKKDSNAEPVYGAETGLPANCRAYIQVAVNDWHRGTYDSETTMDAIERNCGENGSLWDYKPK